jgi:hypothetical protein
MDVLVATFHGADGIRFVRLRQLLPVARAGKVGGGSIQHVVVAFHRRRQFLPRGVNVGADIFLSDPVQKAGPAHDQHRLVVRPAQNQMLALAMQPFVMSRNTPAMTVQMMRLSSPYLAPMPKRMTMNAPVGPPMLTLVPPSAEMMKPAMTAVKMPASGLTPDYGERHR